MTLRPQVADRAALHFIQRIPGDLAEGRIDHHDIAFGVRQHDAFLGVVENHGSLTLILLCCEPLAQILRDADDGRTGGAVSVHRHSRYKDRNANTLAGDKIRAEARRHVGPVLVEPLRWLCQQRLQALADQCSRLVSEQLFGNRVGGLDGPLRDHQQCLAHRVHHAFHIAARYGSRFQLLRHFVERVGQFADLIARERRHAVREVAFGEFAAGCYQRTQRRLHRAPGRQCDEDAEHQRQQQAACDQHVGFVSCPRCAIHRRFELRFLRRRDTALEQILETPPQAREIAESALANCVRLHHRGQLLGSARVPLLHFEHPGALGGCVCQRLIARQHRVESTLIFDDVLLQLAVRVGNATSEALGLRQQVGCQVLRSEALLNRRRFARCPHDLRYLFHQRLHAA